MSATTTTFARSVATLVRLSPRGSTTGPVRAAAATFAAPATPNTRPVLAALPVVWSTNQGIATSARALPVMEMALAERSAAMGDRAGQACAVEVVHDHRSLPTRHETSLTRPMHRTS
jgi:hypothetical protein